MGAGWLIAILKMARGICGFAIRKQAQRGALPMSHAIRSSPLGKTIRKLCSTAPTAAEASGSRLSRAEERFREETDIPRKPLEEDSGGCRCSRDYRLNCHISSALLEIRSRAIWGRWPRRIPQAVEIKHFDDKFRRVT
jgi:hypothetical protein